MDQWGDDLFDPEPEWVDPPEIQAEEDLRVLPDKLSSRCKRTATLLWPVIKKEAWNHWNMLAGTSYGIGQGMRPSDVEVEASRAAHAARALLKIIRSMREGVIQEIESRAVQEICTTPSKSPRSRVRLHDWMPRHWHMFDVSDDDPRLSTPTGHAIQALEAFASVLEAIQANASARKAPAQGGRPRFATRILVEALYRVTRATGCPDAHALELARAIESWAQRGLGQVPAGWSAPPSFGEHVLDEERARWKRLSADGKARSQRIALAIMRAEGIKIDL